MDWADLKELLPIMGLCSILIIPCIAVLILFAAITAVLIVAATPCILIGGALYGIVHIAKTTQGCVALVAITLIIIQYTTKGLL